MSEIPKNLSAYLGKLFPELHNNQDSPLFTYSTGLVNGGYTKRMKFTSGKSTYLFSVCCCQDKAANPAHLFWGAYVIDALDEELRSVLSERGGDFLAHSKAPLFDGVSARRAALSVRRLAEQRLEEDLYHSYGIQFNVFDCLSLTYYEQERAKGNLLFLPAVPDELERVCVWSVSGKDCVECSMENLRVIRKLLAGTEDIHTALLFVRDEGGSLPIFRGAARLENGLPPSAPRLGYVQVCVNGPLRWELLLFGKLVCRRDASGLCFPDGFGHSGTEQATEVAKTRIHDALQSAFTRGDLADAVKQNLRCLTEIVQSVRKQHHGAAIVVADWNREPCKATLDRLIQHRKAVPVTFTDLEFSPAVITSAAKMDGAILADIRSGHIVALAAILDGASCVEGDTSRGARYNSIANATCLLRFSAEQPEVVSFVFSSDGGMDILS